MKKILILLSLILPTILFAQSFSYGQDYCPSLKSSMWYSNPYNNRKEVASLQNFLFNYYGTNINPTGYFGPATKSYVARFQQEKGLYPVTGGVGPLTRNAIAQACRSSNNDQIVCPAIYQPVCGQQLHECCTNSLNKPAYCTYAKVSCEVGKPKTFSNSCQLNAAGAQYLYDGECKNNTVTEAPNNCKVWYDGCNTCSRSYEGGPLACTLMACINNNIWNSGAYCKEYFTQSNEAPVIKSFSGPTQLSVNQKGTWSLQTEIFNNQQLSYNITWGDEKYDYRMAMPIYSFLNSIAPQNTTFEHSYANIGTYTVTITAIAANGQSTKTTATVNVIGNNISSCYDNGISYSEGQSKNCLWINGSNTCIADASYICRSGDWKIESGNWSNPHTICSSDAKQCSDGTWVGRTGPYCQFMCPIY